MNVNNIKLFPHNQDTYNKIQEAWKTSNKVASVQATGTGKSYLQLKCLYNEADQNKIVLAPSNYILEQLEREAGETLPNTTLMTYSKLSFMSDEEIQNLNLSLIIMDEFHRCGAEQWGSGVQKLLDTFSNAKILGTSATHIRFLDNNKDMAEELFDGNVVNNLSLAEAIVKKILPMPKYVSALYTFSDEVENLKNKVNNSKNTDEEKEELLKEIDKMKNKLDKSKGIPKILKKHLDENSSDKFIVFCKNVEHLNEMKEAVVNWFKKAKITKKVDVYTAYTGYNNTDKEVKEFRNNNQENIIKLLFSIDLFNEGIHIKDVSGVILLRPTMSPIIYYQQIGRAIQVGKNTNPLIFDFVNNFDNIGTKNLISDLKEHSKQQKERNINGSDNNNQIDDFEFMIFDEIQEAKILFEQLEDRLIDNWESMYEKLKQYYNENNHSDLPINYKEKQLAIWVQNQRQAYKRKILSVERIENLKKLNFNWIIRKKDWDGMFSLLKKYKSEKGNFCIENDCIYDNELLGKWVASQRNAYIKDKLPQSKIDKLNEIGFPFDGLEYKWDCMLKNLIKYKKDNGTYLVSFNQKEDNKDIFDLYNWTAKLKNEHKRGVLSKERIEKLKNINFSLESTIEAVWFKKYQAYVRYMETNDIKINNSLRQWEYRQKQAYHKRELSPEKTELLNKIRFNWELRTNK